MKRLRALRVLEKKTKEQVRQYDLVKALLEEWEAAPEEVQMKNHDYLLKLRAKVRNHKAYLEHRNDPKAKV